VARNTKPEVPGPTLELACRELLRELALGALEAGGSEHSVDTLVRKVAARVREGGVSSCDRSATVAEAALPPPALLEDLTCSPWLFWRQGCNDGSAAATQALAGLGASRRPSQSSDSTSIAESDEMEGFPASPNGDGLGPLPCAFGRATSNPVEAHWMRQTASANQDVPCSSVCAPGMGRRPTVGSIVFPGNARSMIYSASASYPSDIRESVIVVERGLTIAPHSAQRLMMKWQERPSVVLLIAKRADSSVTDALEDMAAWLALQGITVVLEPELLASRPELRARLPGIRTFSKADRLEAAVDFVVTIGGDGTLTWAVSLFPGAMPPVLSFAAGSMGFLTPFPLKSWVRTLAPLFGHECKPMPLACRMRINVSVRSTSRSAVSEADDGEGDAAGIRALEVQCLNEILVHRGGSSALAKLEVSVDGERVTLVQGDGLILATPTGSTAYSLAAGGSMVHPAVPAMLLTPVSPHSLSFRPVHLPDSAVITIAVPASSRACAALSVDGKDVCTLEKGDSIEAVMSRHPVATLCRTTETKDWFASVNEALCWNGRGAEQKDA